MENMTEVFERIVRTYIANTIKDRPPTEEELQNACTIARAMFPAVTDAEVEAVIRRLQSALDVAMDTGVVITKDYVPWLKARKSEIDFYYWNRYALYLEEDQHRPATVISTIDEVSDRVVDLIGDPKAHGNLRRRGLIIGDVQSGKTANYIAIMNKAADVGFKVIILLTGTIESLRRQTQERVDEGFIGRSSKEYLKRNGQTVQKGVGRKDATRFATGFTTESSDFKASTMNSVNFSLHNMTEPVVFVLKKNARTLQNLIKWLETSNQRQNGRIDLPLLMIDDEADNASINTRDDNDPTAINKHIRKLLNLFHDWSYVGVTATPFANIFILPEKTEEMENDDLFPSDYIYALDAPTNYIGSNELFGDNAAYEESIIRINDAGAFFPYKHKQDQYIPDLPESLYDALRYFLLANVVRDIKGDTKAHRSMLINVSRFTKVQERISELVREWMYETQRDIKNYCMLDEESACANETLQELRDAWNNPDNPFYYETSVDWETVQKNYLMKAVLPIEVRTINQRSSTKMLDYTEYENGMRVIAVGGLSLSRGLTLEGLIVSYFHRNSQMYDTLMQMGRWFGYRSGYERLFRIWMPDDAIGWYAHITQATNELREEIARMNRIGAIPRDFGLKVRAHPTTLTITARNKMKHSDRMECWITLDGKFFETPRFRSELEIIRSNRDKTDEFVRNLLDNCGNPPGSNKQPLFWPNVPRELVCDYLTKYQNHPLNMEADGITLSNYIRKNDNFKVWDVLIYSGSELPADKKIKGFPIRPSARPFSKESGTLSSYGTKMRIGSMGLTKHGLTKEEREVATYQFRESNRANYEFKYGDEAEAKLANMHIPDRAYLIEGRHPILIVHYLTPKEGSTGLPEGFDKKDLLVGYAIGFPKLAGSEPVYAVYYINLVEQQKYMTEEMEEDQLDIDGED